MARRAIAQEAMSIVRQANTGHRSASAQPPSQGSGRGAAGAEPPARAPYRQARSRGRLSPSYCAEALLQHHRPGPLRQALLHPPAQPPRPRRGADAHPGRALLLPPRPRQTGKISALLALRDRLNGGVEGEYRCGSPAGHLIVFDRSEAGGGSRAVQSRVGPTWDPARNRSLEAQSARGRAGSGRVPGAAPRSRQRAFVILPDFTGRAASRARPGGCRGWPRRPEPARRSHRR